MIRLDENTKKLLKRIHYFQELPEPALVELANEIVVRRCQAGEIIFLEGEPAAGLHLIVTGYGKVYRLSEEGREQVLTVLKPGDSCNEVSVVDNKPNPANMSVLEDSILWIISPETMRRLREKYPILTDLVIENLAMRCRMLVQRIHNLAFLPVTGRLAAFLLQQTDEDNYLSRRRWTQEEVAAHLGTVREMVGRALRELHEAGLIEIDRHRIQIVDKAGLKKLI